ncbi:Saccharopine dehydrogenase [Hortaea werneckii]|nr:Saccharopine dehydrogenase [Hortaea werneckii]KAI6873626.1 Saccharopine dehydrogenase [Hortaea werneckii]KAI7355250.1 Saccharopine dehydrogenase [Hortaea werneckii]
MAPTVLHVRAETKPLEHRSAVTPTIAKQLVDAGYVVNIERSPLSIFNDSEYEGTGASLVPTGSWTQAPSEHIIIGLKELPEEDFPLKHIHVQFAHCYKGQGGWEKVLGRFPRGKGTLLDLEFLEDENGRRVAAFGYHAGFAGAALALMTWAWQLTHGKDEPLPGVTPYENEGLLIKDVKEAVESGKAKAGHLPRVLVIGALGRCGRGAVDLCVKAGLEDIIKWDLPETSAKSGPYQEIVESDVFVNCIYLSAKIPPFIEPNSLSSPDRRLSVVCDVSCDTTNPHNPIPIYDINTTFSSPTVPVKLPAQANDLPLSVISIDHLPSLLPREASEAFSSALLPSLLQLNDWKHARVWQQAEKLFTEKCNTLPEGAVDGQAELVANQSVARLDAKTPARLAYTDLRKVINIRGDNATEAASGSYKSAVEKGRLLYTHLQCADVQSHYQWTDLERYGWTADRRKQPRGIPSDIQTPLLSDPGDVVGGLGCPRIEAHDPIEPKDVEWDHLRESTVEGKHYNPTDAWYKGIYYPKHGVLIVSNARSPRYAVEQKKRIDEWEGGELVPLGLLSDVMFLEYEHLCKTAVPPLQVRDLRYMFRSQIVNKETRETIFEVLKRRGVVNGPVAWPGTAFEFPSEEALALLSTPNGRGAAWILFSHRAELGWKTIKQITVFDNLLSASERSVFREWSHPSMLVEFEDSKAPQQDEPGAGKQEQ